MQLYRGGNASDDDKLREDMDKLRENIDLLLEILEDGENQSAVEMFLREVEEFREKHPRVLHEDMEALVYLLERSNTGTIIGALEMIRPALTIENVREY